MRERGGALSGVGGLGDGTYESFSTLSGANRFMLSFERGQRFGLAWINAANRGHAVAAQRTLIGVIYRDYQATGLPWFTPGGSSGSAASFHVYTLLMSAMDQNAAQRLAAAWLAKQPQTTALRLSGEARETRRSWLFAIQSVDGSAILGANAMIVSKRSGRVWECLASWREFEEDSSFRGRIERLFFRWLQGY